MLQHCASCGKVRHYPRPVCPHCFSMESEFKEAPTRRHDPHLDGLSPSLQLLLQGGGALHRGAGRHGCRRARERAAARHRRGRPQDRPERVRLQFEPVTKEVTLAVLRHRVSFREEKQE